MFAINEGTIRIPSAWKDESINVLTTAQGNGTGLSFTISRDTLPWGMAFESFAKKEIAAIASSLKDHKQLELLPMQVDGREAMLSEFSWSSAQGPIHQCMVLTAEQQRALIFTASMPGLISQEQKQQILALVETFRFRSSDDTNAAVVQ